MEKKERGLLQQVRWFLAIFLMNMEDAGLVYDSVKDSKALEEWKTTHSFTALYQLFQPFHKRIFQKVEKRSKS